MDMRDRLQAHGAELDPGQARQLDAAERTIAQAIEANLLKKQEVIGRVRGEKLNAVEARALADAQARLGRPEVAGKLSAELDADAAGTSARRRVLPEDARVGVEGDGKASARPRLPDSTTHDGRGGRMPGGLETPLPDLGGRRPPGGPGVQGHVPGVQGGRGPLPPPPPAAPARPRPPLSLERAYDVVKAHEQSPGRRLSGAQTRELQQARQVTAGEIKRNLERKMAVTGRPLPAEEAQALARAREVLNPTTSPASQWHASTDRDLGVEGTATGGMGGSPKGGAPSGGRVVPPQTKQQWDARSELKPEPDPVQAAAVMNWLPAMKVPAELRNHIFSGAQSLLDLLPGDVARTLPRVNLSVEAVLGIDVTGRYRGTENRLSLAYDKIRHFTPEQIRQTMWHEMGHWLYDKAGDPGAHPKLKKWREAIELHWQERTKNEPILRHPKYGWKYIKDSWIRIYVGKMYGNTGGLEIPSVYLELASWGSGRLALLSKTFSSGGHSTAQETFDIVLSILKS